MKQLMSVLVCVLMIATAASAATTSISELRNDYGGTWNTPPFFAGSVGNATNQPFDRNEDWSYEHDLTAQYDTMVADLEASLAPDEYIASLLLTEASLFIEAYDVESGLIDIYGDGFLIGALNAGDNYVATTFTATDPTELAILADNVLDVDVTYTNQDWRAALISSTLTLVYTYEIGVEEPPEPPSTVPAPGAVLLGSLGAGLVGWLRRQKSL